jgi:hypothetical protein
MEALILLCDAADQVNGKLYILGGGWSLIVVPDRPTPTTVAVKLAVPWDQTNRQMSLLCRLLDEDGNPVDLGTGEVRAEGRFEAGRPPGLKPGTPIDVPLAIPFGALAYPAGGYVFELEVDNEVVARAPFRVLAEQQH